MSHLAPDAPTGAILVVDDSRPDLRLLVELLMGAGHTVRPMLDSAAALAGALAEPPDLVLVDLHMAGLDGFELCARLKAEPQTSEVPVIFISGAGELFNKVRAFAVGGVDFVTKPIQADEVLARVATHLALFRHRTALERLVAERTAELQLANARLQQEIVERKEAEATVRSANNQLREANFLLRTIFDGLSDGLALCDRDGFVLMANEHLAALLGVGVERVIRQPLEPLDMQCATLVGRAAVEEAAQAARVERLHPEVRQIVLDARAIPVPDADGPVHHVVLHLVDVSDQLQYEALALQNERMAAATRLSAMMAHEVNTPLQSIQNLLFLLADDLDAQHAAALALAREEIERISSLIRRVLDLNRPGETPLAPLDVNDLVRRVLLLTRSTLMRQGIEVVEKLGDDLPTVPGRADHLTQVLLNLIFNAIDATERGGTLTLRTGVAGAPAPAVVIGVEDTGRGIVADILPRIFEPFFTTKPQGSGIGLAVCKQIVEQHGGTIAVQSQPGAGTVFSLTLPTSELPVQQPGDGR